MDKIGNTKISEVELADDGLKESRLKLETLYRISNAVNTTYNLDELYLSIHQALGIAIEIEYFYIALYDEQTDILSFPYNTDTLDKRGFDEIKNVSNSTSFTWEVVKTGQPLKLTKKEQYSLSAKLGGDIIGTPSELWLGAPLVVRKKVIGAIVTQSYTNPDQYSAKDTELFISISDQIAIGIERKLAEEKLRTSELRIKSLLTISNAVNTTDNLDDLYRIIHHSLKPIIDVSNFYIALYEQEEDRAVIPYGVDKSGSQFHAIEQISRHISLTGEVLIDGKRLFLRGSQLDDWERKKNHIIYGEKPRVWLGVPLKIKGRVIGAMVVQNYESPYQYSRRDAEIFESVSDQVALALERKRTEQELENTQNELIEKAHKAGMAEVSSGTLHNVGNLLNSVKTSSFIISEVAGKSHVSGLKKANELLKENQGNLADFFTMDPRGDKLLQYYFVLEESLSEENERILEQVNRLNGKIDTIADVITAQQNFASAGTDVEKFDIRDIIEDALTLMSGSVEKSGITVIKDYKDVPVVLIQKTKTIHVLINLFKNARESMIKNDRDNRVIRITVKADDAVVLVQVQDNGQGIETENLEKIFSHGFTTKRDGHGFGLHSCRDYMTEMNGQIWAENKPTGKGSSLFLSFPAATGL